ncbi:MAG: 16S rRNA (guanine(966)-N(2))-methyltransferase RsmD [Rickettsiales bacterium]|nr:16S rRNA (guanine(966)-N(2))-methyltransferase RsmD [Rickettsiales bacterium]
MAMRIISGKHKNRRIEAPSGNEVRPTGARTREAIFNILTHGEYGDREVLQGRVADIFCGSGAMGLEALSRGAKHVTFVDKNRASLDAVEFNLDQFDETENCKILRTDSTQLPPANQPYDLLFLDPPYETGMGIASLKTALAGGWINENTAIVLEQSWKEPLELPDGLILLDERKYGISRMIFAKKA